MTAVHEVRGRLHTARLHLTFLERALTRPGEDPEVVDAVKAASEELRQLERIVLALLALAPPGDGTPGS